MKLEDLSKQELIQEIMRLRKRKNNKRISIKTKKRDIVDYWSKIKDECLLSVDWSEAETRCWRCGYQKDYKDVI